LFDDAHGTDDSTNWAKRHAARNVVINRKALAALRFHSAQEAVGRTLGGPKPVTIIGVIDQLRFFSPRQPDDATYYVYFRELQANLVASIRFTGDPRVMLEQVRANWGANQSTSRPPPPRPSSQAAHLHAAGAANAWVWDVAVAPYLV
jgi:putative ABC transport system permease protein